MTTTAVAVLSRIKDMDKFLKELGDNIARCGMCGCETVQQGHVIAASAVLTGRDPLSLAAKIAEDFHFISGKPKRSAVRMLYALEEMGGKYRIIRRTSEEAAIEIEYGGRKETFRLTWEEAEKEPFTQKKSKEGKVIGVSNNYATPRKRMQMMWCRVVSDGVHAMCPGAVLNRYTPEEYADIDGSDITVDDPLPEVTDLRHVGTSIPEVPAMTSYGEPTATETPRGSATHAAIAEIKTLYDALEVPHEKREEILRKYGTGSMLGLSQEQAAELLGKLRAKVAATIPPAESVEGPCPVELSDRIKSLLAEVSQVAGHEDVAAKVKAKLQAAGLARLTDLSLAEAERLQAALESRQMAAFFDASLAGYKPKN